MISPPRFNLPLFHLDIREHMYYRYFMETEARVRVSALASGSSGNAFLVETADTKLLFDAGLNISALEHYLHQRGASASQLSAIFVSHEHIDHLRGAGMLARRYNLPVVATQGTFSAGMWQFGSLPEKIVQTPGAELRMGDILVRTFALSHDAAETVGFWIEAGGRTIVLCTDLGCETDTIRDPLQAADLLVLEANHDIQRLWRGPYHPSLKRRVAGPKGHLANTEAARLVSELAQDGRPRNIWLAHLSAANNTPDIALETVTEPLNQQGCTHLAVAVLARDVPSRIWSAAAVA
jgi:phosphoribosyl 1,2-cyclic phosphodiesterase